MITPDYIKAQQHAKKNNLPLPIAAMDLHSANIKNPMYWPDVEYFTSEDDTNKTPNIIQYGGWVADLAKAKSAEVIFPENSAFLHGLGVIAAAAGYNFKYQYYSEQKAVNLFCVASQPPSTGKSSIFSFFSKPFATAFSDLNKDNAKKRNKLEKELKELITAFDEGQNVALEIEQTMTALADVALVKWYMDDVTPEAAESVASKQSGYLNIISPESDAVNVILGNVYGEGKGKANHGLFLKMWDTEWHSSARVTRDGYEGELYGSVSVLAQDESIDTILRIGQESGRGISERFLLIREPNLFGKRKSSSRVKVDPELTKELNATAVNIVRSPDVVLTFSNNAFAMINAVTDELDDKMTDGREFSSSMIRGAAGKADKQIYKIASIMHIAEDWRPSGKKRSKVDDKHVKNAIKIFMELLKTYLGAADDMRISGISTEVSFVSEKITELTKKKTHAISVARLRDEIRNRGPLKGVSGITEKIRGSYLPELQKRGYIVEHEGTIYINPKLA
jgi:Protein of unknown function (DUF3987)